MQFTRLWTSVHRLQRPPKLALAVACAVGVLIGGLTLAQPQLDKTQQLAMERYGQRADRKSVV